MIKQYERVEDVALVAYLAGIIDGEGSTMYRRKAGRSLNETPALHISVTMAEQHVVQLLCDTFGGTVRFRKRIKEHHRDLFLWEVSHRKAEAAYERLVPYLRIKTKAYALRER